MEKLTQRHNRREQADLDDCDNETCASTQFLQIQKKQLIDQEPLERYCNVLPVLGLNSAKYDLNLSKSYMLPILNNERDIASLSSRKRTNSSRSNLVIFDSRI